MRRHLAQVGWRAPQSRARPGCICGASLTGNAAWLLVVALVAGYGPALNQLDGSSAARYRQHGLTMGASELSVVVPDAIWVSERPVWFSGVRLRARSTVLRLEDGGLLVHSPPEPTDELCAALRALGEVRWIVVPNRFHHLAARATAARFAGALVVGPTSAVARNPQLQLHMALQDQAFLGAVKEIDAILLEGCPFLDETVLFHRPTGSLIGADVVMSACARDHWSWRWAGRLTGRYDKVGTPPDVRMKTKPNDAAARAIDRMAALPLKRLLVAHADVIEDPAEKLLDAWRFVRKA